VGARNLPLDGVRTPYGKGTFYRGFTWNQIWMSAYADAITNVCVRRRCGPLASYFGHLLFYLREITVTDVNVAAEVTGHFADKPTRGLSSRGPVK